MTEYLVALLPQHGVGQQINGTRLSTRGRATRRGGCPVYTHATHYVPHEAVLTPKHSTETTKYPTGAWSVYLVFLVGNLVDFPFLFALPWMSLLE
jgi:hypothetical protein